MHVTSKGVIGTEMTCVCELIHCKNEK